MERNTASTERSVEVRNPHPDPSLQGGLGGLKELVSKWFMETQAAGLALDGHFPDWFQGFATRKDAEEQLKDKAVGEFLVRLSEKAIGYVLSYKGVERCRHFVISQRPEGHFCITGDEQQQHSSVFELIQHYKVSPIQPFGEFLTNSQEQEEQEDTTEMYDVVNVNLKGKSGVSVKALRCLWDQKGLVLLKVPPHTKSQKFSNNDTEQGPVLPPKSTRGLSGSKSVDTTALFQCTANEAESLGFLSTSSSPDHHLQNRPLTPNPALQSGGDEPPNSPRSIMSQITYSSLIQPENRSKSLPSLDQKEQPTEPTNHPKKVTCLTYSVLNEELLRLNPSRKPMEALQAGSPYAEVTEGAKKVDPTYEYIVESEKDHRSNPYESIQELKTKKDKFSWGKNKERKNFFTDYLKK
ncbi:uncharacterized protein sh2d7 [Eucyclogobius newberryi]|uniref:uncharacterized protein sh2d7 n=1 Tax=Eucyclogobius newberryi TaxID=166745 RepID=UPI003B58F9C0